MTHYLKLHRLHYLTRHNQILKTNPHIHVNLHKSYLLISIFYFSDYQLLNHLINLHNHEE